MNTLEQIKRDLWQAGQTDTLDAIQALTHAFEHLHEISEAAHAVNDDNSDEGAWMFLSGECLDYESPGVPELSERLATALRSYAAAERARCLGAIQGLYHGDACRSALRALDQAPQPARAAGEE
jgi:hypothetical protein